MAVDNEEILSKCFDCMVSEGLEKTSIRSLCKHTGMVASSFYYRWSSRDEIILEATWQGLRTVVSELCGVFVNNFQNFGKMFHMLMRVATLNKRKIELIYQVVNSPKYGEKMRQNSEDLNKLYSQYASMLANNIGCTESLIHPYVIFAIDTLRGYIIWGDRNLAESQMQFIYEKVTDMRLSDTNERKGK